jgi:hypothetical protein
VIITLRPITLGLFERACLEAGRSSDRTVMPDRVLLDGEEWPVDEAGEFRSVPPALFVEAAQTADGLEMPPEALAVLAPSLTLAFVAACRDEAVAARQEAAVYAHSCGASGLASGMEGEGVSLARLCSREGSEGWHRLRHEMPLRAALLYFLVAGIDQKMREVLKR